MADLFSIGDLASYLQVPDIDDETTIRVRRYASGWLMAATGLTSWPDPIPDDLWAWAIELAAIAFYNPDGKSREQIDDYLVQYASERRAEILDAAAASPYSVNTRHRPSYAFPPWDWTWTAVPVPNPLVN